MEAYCVKCKTKREIVNPQPVFTAAGTPATKGACPVCGTALFRMGRTPAHDGIPRPEATARSPRNGKRNGAPAERRGALVIVESPAKAKTVGRFLGRKYTVKASVGHVRDLLKSQLSVDVDNGFAPKYRVPNEKKAVVKELAELGRRAEQVYLATDPDREGEAIAWHLVESADFERERVKRVVFHEITEHAIGEAFAHPRSINMELVNAQQARRILDRLVGYKLSPLLWEKVRSRLSAGRVQSVALRLIVEREREVQAFVPVEYWSVHAELAKHLAPQVHAPKKRPSFLAKLIKVRGQDVDLKNEADAQAIVDELRKADYVVASVKKGERRRRPNPPFTTSTLQQEANRKLGYPARRTMALAQQLYEGIALGDEGSVGLITYMRTDSTTVAAEAQQEARTFVGERYGAEYLPDEPPQYKTRSKNAQEAHEAIRPTSVRRTPEAVKPFLDAAQLKLYSLIWKRFLASQMNAAVYDTVSVDIAAGDVGQLLGVIRDLGDGGANGAAGRFPYLFRSTGSTLRFAGYLVVYEEARDEDVAPEEDEGARIPELDAAELLDLLALLPDQHFTGPPPRYTEASLVKALEENGIGRPSTYAPILSTIQARGYVEKREKRLWPTDVGFIVNDMLVEYFSDVIDVGFTARMEEELDEIADGEKDWAEVLREFYEPFEKDVEHALHAIEKVEVNEEIGEACPTCGKPLIARWGRFGKFIGCSDFPTCRYTRPFLIKIGVKCPLDGGDLVEKKTRRGRIFYGCANYKNDDPDSCQFTSWNRPLPQPCPNCGGLLTVKGKDRARCLRCENEYSLNELPEMEPVAD
ncbi:MAG TPA: type I DNA topoisomerase [Anaerolineae bacterium]|nr:type I DNA topoisomerase [Anaerolineae bacterium]